MKTSIFLIQFLVFLVFFVMMAKRAFKGMKIEKELAKKLDEFGKLEEIKKLHGYFPMVHYVKERLPWGSFSRNYDNFYDKDDTEEIKELKNLWILNVIQFRKILFFALVPMIILMPSVLLLF